MINKVAIKYLYKHTKRPKDGLPKEKLEEVCRLCEEHFKISFDDEFMTIGSLDDCSPFKKIRISCIRGFEIADCEVAAVLNYCILFFNNRTGTIKINFKTEGIGFWQRLKLWFSSSHCHCGKQQYSQQ